MDANQNHRAAGAIVEDIALAYLEQHDYKLLARNFFSRHGEIDLIMSRQQCIVFCRGKTSTIDPVWRRT